MTASTIAQRAALYLRVSMARQAEHDVSIPDQKRQGETYCASRGYQLVETYVEPGASATNDRRPEFQRMIEAGTSKPAPFDVVVVHSFMACVSFSPHRHGPNSSSKRSPNHASNTSTSASVTGMCSGQSSVTVQVERSCFGGRPGKAGNFSSCSETAATD